MKFCIQAIIVSLGFAAVAAAAAATATPPTTYTTSYSESKLRSPSSQQQRKLGIINAVDTSETYYAEDAQAWRYLGTYIDCSENDTCQRYLLWAAYVDKEYTGDKDGSQYMFYNEVTEKWDNSYCDLLNGDDSRCVPMDCHLPNTHWSLIGYYKEAGVVDFLEQLSYHQGSCQWTSEESQFVDSSIKAFPDGCTASSLQDPEYVNYLYYDVKPTWPSRMSIGLYVDEKCSEPYEGDYYTVEDVIQSEMEQNNDDDYFKNTNIVYGSKEWTDDWNKALNKYKKCQPCKASLFGNNNYLSEARESRRFLQGDEDEERRDEDEDEERRDDEEEQMQEDGEDEQQHEEDGDEDNDEQQGQGGALSCKDANGNYGVNQCSKFAQNTNISPATWKDLRLATLQGTIAPVHVSPKVTSTPVQKWWRAWGFFTISLITFLLGLLLFCSCVKVKKRYGDGSDRSQPLLFGGGGNRSRNSDNNRRSSRR